jgi:hypothetical protein
MQEDTAWAAAPTTRCVQTRRCLPLLPLKNGHAEKAREERRPESLLHPGAVSAGRGSRVNLFPSPDSSALLLRCQRRTKLAEPPDRSQSQGLWKPFDVK